jgi:hypothetical protein
MKLEYIKTTLNRETITVWMAEGEKIHYCNVPKKDCPEKRGLGALFG